MLLFFLLGFISEDGVAVGPEGGKPVPTLKTLQVHGPLAGKELDWQAASGGKRTLLVFVRSDRWDRPLARVLRKLDDIIQEERQKKDAEVSLAIIWITKDLETAKEYLPRAQQSLKLQTASWNIFKGDIFDATGWVLSGDATINFILLHKNQATWGRSFTELNEQPARAVLSSLENIKKE